MPAGARVALPPPLPRYAPRRVAKPPPLPKRVIAYVTSIDKNSSTAIWSVIATVIVVVAVAVVAYRQTVTVPAQQAVVAEEAARFIPIREAVRAAQPTAMRPLAGTVAFRRMYIQNDLILRYQVYANHLKKQGLQLYISYTTEKPKFLSIIAADAIAEPALRQASSIYVDVYDANSEFLYSYDLRPSHLWPDAVDPEPIE